MEVTSENEKPAPKTAGEDDNSSSHIEAGGASAPVKTDERAQATTPAPTEDQLPPDGGVVAWLQVMGSFFLFMNSWGLVNTYGVYQTFYELDMLKHESPSNISWVGSVQACLLLVVGVATGPLFDMGHFDLLLIVGSFLVIFGMMMTSLCTEYWQVMLAQGITTGLGFGCLFLPSVAIVSTYFTTKKAFATGVAASGSSLGGVVYTITFSRLQPRIGFPWATRVIAFISLATLSLCIVVMRVRIRPKSTRRLLELHAFRDVAYTMFSFGQLFGILGLYVPFYYIQTYALEHGVDRSLAFYLVTILNATSIFGRLAPNYLADKIGPLNVLVPASFASAVLAFAWIGIKSTPGLIVFCVLYGFTSGSFVSLPPTIVVTLSPSLNVVGTRMGMSFSFAGLGILLGNPVAGVILRRHGWLGLQCWAGATIVAAGVAIAVVRFAKNPKLLGRT